MQRGNSVNILLLQTFTQRRPMGRWQGHLPIHMKIRFQNTASNSEGMALNSQAKYSFSFFFKLTKQASNEIFTIWLEA